MSRYTFQCIDAHTCGNPVRVVTSGIPDLVGSNMAEKRLDFLSRFDWIRKGLMFEPRGHDMMSGSMLFPPHNPHNDAAILFIETSGCLPMCGHGTIGTITVAIEHGLIHPATPGLVRLETPAGLVEANYVQNAQGKVTSVRIKNVPSFLYKTGVQVLSPDLGKLVVDIAYGGNFYAIIDPQEHFAGIENFTASELVRMSPIIRQQLNNTLQVVHPTQPEIRGLSHILWTGKTLHPDATARNAVFYGEKAIDRSPCGTGTSARMAQWHAQGRLLLGQPFIHESIIGSQFTGKIEALTKVGDLPAIIPSIEGWAVVIGINTLFIDTEEDPFAHGFTVL